jgi:hypothetical protein
VEFLFIFFFFGRLSLWRDGNGGQECPLLMTLFEGTITEHGPMLRAHYNADSRSMGIFMHSEFDQKLPNPIL